MGDGGGVRVRQKSVSLCPLIYVSQLLQCHGYLICQLFSLTGYYLYMETSKHRNNDDRLALYSPTIRPSLPKSCLTFAYHMFGNRIGTLSVLIGTTFFALANASTVWKATGNKGNQWFTAKVELNTPDFIPYKVCRIG